MAWSSNDPSIASVNSSGVVTGGATGDAIAVAVPEYLDYGLRNGGIEFWSVKKGDKPTLTKQPGRISLTRGVHAIKVIP